MNNEGITLLQPPVVTFATNKFINVPVILKYDDINLIEIIKTMQNTHVTYETSISIYHPDRTKLAKVVGTRIVLTEDGKKVGVTLEYPANMTVCKLGNETLFEIKRIGATSISIEAELYTPNGYMIKSSNDANKYLKLYNADKEKLQINGVTMRNNSFDGCNIGIHVKSSGQINIGCM